MSDKAKIFRGFPGLSTRLITLIIFVILVVEVLIFLPSLANSRANWLDNRLQVGAVAVRVLDAVPKDMKIPPDLADRLLVSAGATAIVFRRDGQSQLISQTGVPMPTKVNTVDMSQRDPLTLIMGGLDTLFNGQNRTLRILGTTKQAPGTSIEILMPETPLRSALLIYARNIFFLSLFVATITAMVVFLFLNRLFIRPIKNLTANIIAFRQAPENASLIIVPSDRRDEIGMAECELADMEADLFSMLRQRRHLADLGLAVAKITHDLRNTLTSAQLLSDQVATLDDPQVQRLAPRLVLTLDKAIGFAQSVLDYGRQSAKAPKPQPVDLRALIKEVAFDAGLAGHPDISLVNEVPDAISILVDPDQMARILHNLIKNAREALEVALKEDESGNICVSYVKEDGFFVISVSDNGPGLPPRARANLFVAFKGSARAGGSGLGLVIARELTESHGGRLSYVEQEKGARFDIRLPSSKRIS